MISLPLIENIVALDVVEDGSVRRVLVEAAHDVQVVIVLGHGQTNLGSSAHARYERPAVIVAIKLLDRVGFTAKLVFAADDVDAVVVRGGAGVGPRVVHRRRREPGGHLGVVNTTFVCGLLLVMRDVARDATCSTARQTSACPASYFDSISNKTDDTKLRYEYNTVGQATRTHDAELALQERGRVVVGGEGQRGHHHPLVQPRLVFQHTFTRCVYVVVKKVHATDCDQCRRLAEVGQCDEAALLAKFWRLLHGGRLRAGGVRRFIHVVELVVMFLQ